MKFNPLKRIKNKGLFSLVVATIALIIFFFFKLLPNLNNTYFSSEGDGLRTYYSAMFQVQKGEPWFRMDGLNYPYGEMSFYSDCQPLVTSFIKFFDLFLFDGSGSIVGIINFLMLFSILLGALFLYLILKKLKLPNWYSVIVAIGIVFLSPQIQRMGGHFALSWLFWIPMMIYLLMRFEEEETWKISGIIGASFIVAGAMHMYFQAFFIFLVMSYWIHRAISIKEKPLKLVHLWHFLIQIIVPLLFMQIIIRSNDWVIDRTTHPWGFYTYISYFGSIFLPVNKWYLPFFNDMEFVKKYDWESFSYIGVVSTIGFMLLIIRWVIKNIKSKWKNLSFTGNRILDTFFWASFAALLLSMGLPFILGFDKLRNMIGFIGQLRGIARFSWIFYYMINIIVFYVIYNEFIKDKKIGKKGIVIAIIALTILSFEAFISTYTYQNLLANKIPELSDRKDVTDDNRWVMKVDAQKYQAILPLPYFHKGSESFWLEPKCNIARYTYIASLKTGLPTNAVLLNNTSISQSYKNLELVKMPWKEYRVLEMYNDPRPLLLLVANCNELSDDEKRLISVSTKVTDGKGISFYRLELDSLRALPAKVNLPKKYDEFVNSLKEGMKYDVPTTFYRSTENRKRPVYQQEGVREFSKWNNIAEGAVLFTTGGKAYLRFWIRDYDKDLIARTQLLVIQSDLSQNTLDENYTDVHRNIKTLDNDWCLVEIPFMPKQKNEIIKLLIRNTELQEKSLYFDDFSVSEIPL